MKTPVKKETLDFVYKQLGEEKLYLMFGADRRSGGTLSLE